jgi:glycosyltransferase involved in cell wall biosynthesis
MGMYVPVVRSLVKKRLYHRLMGQAHVAGAERIVATSTLEYQQLLGAGLPVDKLVLRRNGLTLAEFADLPARGSFRKQLNLSPTVPLVLFLGRLSRIKSLDLLLRAFAMLSMESRLVLAGPDDGDGCVEECRSLARRLGVEDRVRWVGPLDGVRKLAAYVDADVFVLPSLSENFGYVAVEAAVCGTAVVLTNRCGSAALLDGRAAIVVPHDDKAVASAIQRLLENDVLRKRLGEGGRAMLRELSWEEPAAQMERVYFEILNRRTTAPTDASRGTGVYPRA